MIPTILIGLLVLAYAAYVIHKKVRDAKAGKFCSCGCGGCVNKCGAKIPEKEEL